MRAGFSQSAFRFRPILCGVFGLGLSLVTTSPVWAQSNSAIAQQFQTNDRDVVPTSLVSLQTASSNAVELGSTDNLERLAGVVGNSPLIELSEGKSGVQVVTSGLTLALVSDLGGRVVAGDKITGSPIAGVGMKAGRNTVVVGTAQAKLDIAQAKTRTVTDKAGKQVTVHIGLVPVQVGVAFYSGANDPGEAFVPPFLQGLANDIVGRNVAPLRVLLAALTILLIIIVVSVLLYAAVRSSLVSIGRNPLSQGAVRKGLLDVGLAVAVLMVLGGGLAYLLLVV